MSWWDDNFTRSDFRSWLTNEEETRVKIENYFRRKWGGAPRGQVYKTPFNK